MKRLFIAVLLAGFVGITGLGFAQTGIGVSPKCSDLMRFFRDAVDWKARYVSIDSLRWEHREKRGSILAEPIQQCEGVHGTVYCFECEGKSKAVQLLKSARTGRFKLDGYGCKCK